MSQKKIAVLVVISLAGGGGERSVLTLGKGLFNIGYDVHIIQLKNKVEYELIPELNYHHVGVKKLYFIPKSIRYQLIARYVDKYILKNIGAPNFVLSNLEMSDKIMAHSQLNNVAIIIRNNVTVKNGLSLQKLDRDNKNFKWINEVYSKKPCICLSKGLENDLHKLLDTPPVTQTINNPFDKISILQMAEEPLPNDLNVLTNSILDSGDYLLHIGSFKAQKAHDVLLKAYAKSSQKYPLILLGKGKLMEQMRQLAIELDIGERVHFLGFHGNPYPILRKAKAMVLSSHYEGFVRVVVESLVVGTPVISTDCPFGPNEVLPKKNLVFVNDVSALAEKMTQCMANPQAFFVPFDDRLLPENIAKQYETFFEGLSV